jgi:hypothetical protein
MPACAGHDGWRVIISGRRPKRVDLYGEPGGTRTHGPKIKSLVLYHLSYGLSRQSDAILACRYFTSAATRMCTMRSGLDTVPPPPAPRLSLSTNSMPCTTWPQMVYCPSRCGAGANMM